MTHTFYVDGKLFISHRTEWASYLAGLAWGLNDRFPGQVIVEVVE
jgi:hypothetical protein